MKNPPTITNPDTPALFDKPIIDINKKMIIALDWLTGAYGKAQKLSRLNDQKKVIKYPAVFTGVEKEYASMLPEEGYGNFSYWELSEEYKIDWIDNQIQKLEADFGVIYWFNINNVLPVGEHRNIENIKQEILNFFTNVRAAETRIQITGITDSSDMIYKGYSIKEIEQQYLMHPYAGLRFNGTINYERLCNL